MKTCVSIDCPFIGICKDYNLNVDRSDGCKTKSFILKRALGLMQDPRSPYRQACCDALRQKKK